MNETITNKHDHPPYKSTERKGVKIGILSMITPAIPAWIAENKWARLRFDDMEETARKWMKVIREDEKADVVIGVFHAGQNAIKLSDKYNENASLNVALTVPGFDAVMMGHDHRPERKQLVNAVGDTVWVVNPANDGNLLSELSLIATLKDGKVTGTTITNELVDINNYEVDDEFIALFALQFKDVTEFVSK